MAALAVFLLIHREVFLPFGLSVCGGALAFAAMQRRGCSPPAGGRSARRGRRSIMVKSSLCRLPFSGPVSRGSGDRLRRALYRCTCHLWWAPCPHCTDALTVFRESAAAISGGRGRRIAHAQTNGSLAEACALRAKSAESRLVQQWPASRAVCMQCGRGWLGPSASSPQLP